jgi:hypothetical protein
MNNKSFVWVKIPRCGLGNQLFPIALGLLFAHKNNLPIYFTNYSQIKIGPYLRSERTKRNYRHLFKFDKGFLYDTFLQIKLLFSIYTTHEHVFVSNEQKKLLSKCAYIFESVPSWRDYFNLLNDNRLLVIELILNIINKDIINKVELLPFLEFSLHIRLGDFAKLNQNQDFSNVGCTRTPSDYFIEIITIFNQINPQNKVFIFSDGYKGELNDYLTSENVVLIQHGSDLIDLLHMSKSKYLAMSAGSTFSYWAGFLGEALMIHHDSHPPCVIKKSNTNTIYSLSSFRKLFKH